jgi:hypothetical protein
MASPWCLSRGLLALAPPGQRELSPLVEPIYYGQLGKFLRRDLILSLSFQ